MTKKAISFTEFNELPKELQLHLLHKDGVYVGKRQIENKPVMLFQLYTFYVEVHFQEYRTHVNKIITSDHADILQPYLGQIHIRDLDLNSNKEEN